MHIALGVDEKYVMPCGVLIQSVLDIHPHTKIHFHILTETLSANSKEQLEKTAQRADVSMSFYNIEDWKEKDTMPIKHHFSLAIYYRLFIAGLLPDEVSKVLYLDCDMLVVDDLQPLWNTDLEGYPLAASPDLHYDDIQFFNRLDYPPEYGYFNSGMLLFNLEIWRAEHLSAKIFSFIGNNLEKCVNIDQDAINYVLRGRIKRLSFRYNMQEFTSIDAVSVRKEMHTDMLEARALPVIIHFIGGIKPWHLECENSYKDLWKFVQQKTRWAKVKDTPAFSPWDRYALVRLAKVIGRYLLQKDKLPPYVSPNLPLLYKKF